MLTKEDRAEVDRETAWMRKNSDLSERELQEFRRWMFDEMDGDRNEWVAEAHGPCD